jgi:ribonucleotide reductase beta subunit family protein with ferritin-like domain
MPKHKPKLTEDRSYYKPFNYPFAFESWLKHEQAHWIHLEVPMAEDVKDWNSKLTPTQKNFLTHIFRFFTQGDIDVAGAYVNNYLPFFKQPEVRMMLLGFAAREALHIAAYSHLVETLGMPETTYNEFLEYKEMAEKHEYITSLSLQEKDKETIAANIAAFSAFTEGMQLFSSFIMLLNFPRHGLMKGMGQIVSWSIVDEAVIKGTEVMTKDKGWVPIETLSIDDEIYQYDMQTRSSSFTKLQKIQQVQRDTTYLFDGPNFNQHVSPNHRMIIEKDGVVTESTAEQLNMEENFKFIISGPADGKLQCMMENNTKETNSRILALVEQIAKGEKYVDSTEVTKTTISHDSPQDLYCVAVPGKAFYIKSNDQVSVTGNTMHCESMIKIFRTYVEENKEIWNDTLKARIYTIAERMVELEDKFIDLAFDMGEMENLTADDVKKYIRYITDRRLISLGLKGIFKVKRNPLKWVETMINAPTHTNFFENRSTDYAKGALTGDWSEVWENDTRK